MTSDVSMRCEALSVRFGGTQALSDVSLALPSSGILALVGPNGAGKSTLIDVLTGFVRVDSGRCFLGSRETTSLPPHRIAQLGIARTFQRTRLIPQLSVLDNVLLGRPNQRGERLWAALLSRGVYSEEKDNLLHAKALLAAVGLSGEASAQCSELSFGQQKLLSLALVLATDARILFLDEPIAGVFEANTLAIREQILLASNAGKLVVFSEHGTHFVREIADEVVVMRLGQIVARGLPDDVLKHHSQVHVYER